MTQTAAATPSSPFFCTLTDQGLIRASGEDACGFLHNLLTNDINHIAAEGVRRAALCTAKGRMIASFTIWREGADYLLLLSADILPAILKKLSMYVLRSKVKLTDISAERTLIGVAGGALASLGVPAAPMSSQALPQGTGGVALRLDADHAILVVPADQAAALQQTLAAQFKPAQLADWHLAEIRQGQPRISAATQELFTPQMVNYELAAIGGVSFQKGCYPGQEVVARTHYLGKVKRRMYRVKLAAAYAPGTEVFSPEANDQHCGAVVLTAAAPDGGYESLLVVQSSGAESNAVRVGTPAGEQALLLPLPYTVE